MKWYCDSFLSRLTFFTDVVFLVAACLAVPPGEGHTGTKFIDGRLPTVPVLILVRASVFPVPSSTETEAVVWAGVLRLLESYPDVVHSSTVRDAGRERKLRM